MFDRRSADIWAPEFHKDFHDMHVDGWMMHQKEFTDARSGECF